ncbi:TBPIP-domain-containing protein [Meredithblackwellia eburnea MCA 4105]
MASKKEKVASVKGDQADEIILGYLTSQNRPYGATDISANLKNKVSKAQAAKSLAALHERGEIMGKAYGKTIVYCALQKEEDTMSPEDLQLLESDITSLKEEEFALKEQAKSLIAQKALLMSSPRTQELDEKVKAAVERCAILDSHLTRLRRANSTASSVDGMTVVSSQSTSAPITKDSLAALDLSFKTVLATLDKRRKVAKEVEGILFEMFGKKKGEESECWDTVGADGEVVEMEQRVRHSLQALNAGNS